MNLKSLFNINFFKENIKKSSGILAFFLGVIPIINILFLVINLINEHEILGFSELSVITILGLFIIPVVLATSLFGFVFKGKSVDFVMSKPLSRKTIYFTNIFGGVIVLALFILINALIIGGMGLFTNLVVPFNLLLDYIIYFLIGYIFVYISSVIAISLAGNFITSIVVLLLITYLMPFLYIVNFQNSVVDINSIECTKEECKPSNYSCYEDKKCLEELEKGQYNFYMYKKLNYKFTAPTEMLKAVSDDIVLYSNYGIIKMVILSIVYTLIGYYIFKKRHMEENETDFKSEFKHYFVKSLTLIPICLFTYILMMEDITGFIIGLALTIIYYFIYDLITRKGIYRFLKSLLICVITFGVFNGVYALYDNIPQKHEKIKVLDITSITLENYDITVTDKSLINDIVKDTIGNSLNVTLGTYIINNQEYYGDIKLSNTTKDKLNNLVQSKKLEEIKSLDLNKISYVTFSNEEVSIPVSKELKDILKKLTINSNYSLDSDYITVYVYKNHKYNKINIPISLSNDLYNYVIKYNNLNALNELETIGNAYFYTNENKVLSEEEIVLLEYILNSNLKDFKNYVKNETIKMNDENLIIYYSYENKTSAIIITDASKFREEFNKYKKAVENNIDYQRQLNDYKNNYEGYNEY